VAKHEDVATARIVIFALGVAHRDVVSNNLEIEVRSLRKILDSGAVMAHAPLRPVVT
jgi:hypothetical protein